MNTDITFCANRDQCPQAVTCRRAHWPTDLPKGGLYMASLYEPEEEGKCRTYWPTGEFGMPTFKGGGK